MDTNEKIEQIIESLVVKTRNNLCKWHYISNNKFKLTLSGGIIYLSAVDFSDGNLYVVLDIFNHSNTNVAITTIKKQKDSISNLAILYTQVYNYYKEYINDYIHTLIKEIDNLREDPPEF